MRGREWWLPLEGPGVATFPLGSLFPDLEWIQRYSNTARVYVKPDSLHHWKSTLKIINAAYYVHMRVIDATYVNRRVGAMQPYAEFK